LQVWVGLSVPTWHVRERTELLWGETSDQALNRSEELCWKDCSALVLRFEAETEEQLNEYRETVEGAVARLRDECRQNFLLNRITKDARAINFERDR
jgi:hypothetical protein